MSYGSQPYPDPPVSTAFTSSIEQPASADIPFLYPLPCHKFGYYTTTSSTVITHTASTVGSQSSVQQAPSYPHTQGRYAHTPCHSLSYLASVSDSVHPALPSVTATHCFSVPEKMAVTGPRGKHKQKTGGVKTAVAALATSGPPSTAPSPTSCLAKLLSSSARESVIFFITSSTSAGYNFFFNNAGNVSATEMPLLFCSFREANTGI